ncbi:hypothetical protein T35B1_15276 [Salinisphaera shabanensis T35B1]|uniref:Uncharacterized protein n=1 Tax=Salinisphaera shabanensis E1L3A TaxID=1033802 RepID=U2G0K7_9GAMM|nr:DUF5676 family membrane protein [Salinisphaera shabanensis]ERJ19833.1 hypothetical protein SSPSH_000998 [Salinisphaera shabanensis E1L3A]|tara:strand:- start:1104 stop:1385 length:282 start_codon:yes stop_codon:yes gene_type:complete
MSNATQTTQRLRIGPLGNSLSLLLLISYLLCVGFGLIAPGSLQMYQAWAPLLPGFEWLSFSGFVIGLIEAYLYGWYLAILFVPLYRWFSSGVA